MEKLPHDKHTSNASYRALAFMIAVSFIGMYILMYAMVDVFENVYTNSNQFYMAGLMTAFMVIVEVLIMSRMYKHTWLNRGILLTSALLFVFFWVGIRTQIGVGDKEFLRSMIPHHAGALLMCEEAALKDNEIKELCNSIKEGQQTEIIWMKEKLKSL